MITSQEGPGRACQAPAHRPDPVGGELGSRDSLSLFRGEQGSEEWRNPLKILFFV